LQNTTSLFKVYRLNVLFKWAINSRFCSNFALTRNLKISFKKVVCLVKTKALRNHQLVERQLSHHWYR
jgi:hypothetical protein